MSELSLYPLGIDIFTPKVDETGDGNGDYIMAEHINRIQNAVTSIESTLGTNPHGDSDTVAQRLQSLNKSKTLAIPRITTYTGNPKRVNGAASIEEAARYFNYFTIALLDGVDVYGTAMPDVGSVIEEAAKIGSTKFYGAIDAGVSTSNLTENDIRNIVHKWKDIGVHGIYYKNFGYSSNVSRIRQNALIDMVHDAGLPVIVSASNIDHVLSEDNLLSMNPTNDETHLTQGDGYLFIGYAVQGLYYENSAELLSISEKMIAYRSALGVSMYGIASITGENAVDRDRKYYYGQAAAITYSLDGFHAQEGAPSSETLYIYKTLPLVGGYYDKNPKIRVSGNVVTRFSEAGELSINTASHTYDFKDIRIPIGLIDFNSDDSKIDAGKLTGALSSSVTIDIVGRINTDSSGLAISADKIDISGTKVINSINAAKDEPVKISKEAIEDFNAADIKAIVVEALGRGLEEKLGSGTLDANLRRLTSEFISAMNAYFATIVAETGTFNGIDAGMINVGHLNTHIIDTNAITSDKLSIHGNSGLNKWTGTIVKKATPGIVAEPSSLHIAGKDVYRNIEAIDASVIRTSDSIGTSLTDYVVMWETNVYCTEAFTISTAFTANSNARMDINSERVVKCNPGQVVPYTYILHPGWNVIRVYQDHNSESSCSVDMGIKFSDYSLSTEKGTTTPISRVDAYAGRTTQIIGDLIKTGTINAEKIESNTITANQIKANSILGDRISAGTISGDRLDVASVNATILNAGLIKAIEAYIENITAIDGNFEQILADMLKANLINANNISITSEARDITGNTGVLVIDNGGLVVAQYPKGKIAVLNETLVNTSDRVYQTSHGPVCQEPAPVLKLKDQYSVLTSLNKNLYTFTYETGQVLISESVDLVNKTVVASSYSYYDAYYPSNSRVVRIDRNGISISNDGGRPDTWETKLDGSRLYVGTADIFDASIITAKIADAQITNAKIYSMSADKLTAGTIDAKVINVVNLDASNITTGTLTASESLSIQGGNVIIDNRGILVDGSAGIHVVTNGTKEITLDSDGLISDNFKIKSDGSVEITGTLTAMLGSKIANWIIGEDTIHDSENKIVMDSSIPSINVDNGKAILGLYDNTDPDNPKYGLKATAGKIGGMEIDDTGVVIGAGRITDGAGKYTLDSTGITSVAGYFGDSSNRIGIDSGGLVLGTGSIVDTRDTGTQLLKIDASGITAKAGYIGNLQVTMDGILAQIGDISNRVDQFKITPDTITLKGDQALTINTGSIVIKDSGVNYVKMGKLGMLTYGMRINLLGSESGPYIQLDQNGLRAHNGSINTLNVGSDGNVSISGAINANTGTLGTLTVTGTITVNGSIVAGDTTLNSTGLSGTGYSLNASGLSATKGSVAGWIINDTVISKGNLVIDSTNEKITTTGAVFGKYDSTDPDNPRYGIKADTGMVGGWRILNNSLSTPNILIDSANDIIDIASEVLLGKYEDTNYGLKAGNVVLNSSGLTGPSFSLNDNGMTATLGSIAGWTIGNSTISKGTFILDSAKEKLTIGTSVVLNGDGSAKLGNLTIDADGGIAAPGFNIPAEGAAEFSGRIKATEGWFGTETNHVSISGNGLLAGSITIDSTGIKLGSVLKIDSSGIAITDATGGSYLNFGNGKFMVDGAGGMSATYGSIGGWQIDNTSIFAGVRASKATSPMIIDNSGKISVTNNGTEILAIGKYGPTSYGIIAKKGSETTFEIGHDGSVKLVGDITASTGHLGDLSVTGNISIVDAGGKRLDINPGGVIATQSTGNQVIMDGDGIKVMKDGTVLGSAITPDGIMGQLLTEQSIPGSKFDKTPPAIPDGISAHEDIEQTATSEFINIHVSWNAVTDSDLEGYKVYLKEGSTGTYYPMGVIPSSQTSYVIRNVKGSTQYYAAVSAYDVTGNESLMSAEVGILTTRDTVAPAKVATISAISGLKMFYIKWSEVTQNWNNGTPTGTCNDIHYYELQRKTEQMVNGTPSLVENWTTINKAFVTGIIDKDVSYDYIYSYRVRAVDISGNFPTTNGVDEWTSIEAGSPSKVGAADIVAGSITADVVNIGSMVKSINPIKTILFHYDGVLTSTQDLRPTLVSGGAWVNGKYGDALALEDATKNIVSEATNGNAGFKNGLTGWTSNGAIYSPTGGIGGTSDGYVAVTEANTISITLDTIAGQKYVVSAYAKSKSIAQPANIIIKAGGAVLVDSTMLSDWYRVFYVYTAEGATTTFTFASSSASELCIDNIQVEQNEFMTAFTESYSIEGTDKIRTGVRPEGLVQYAADKLSPREGIITLWFRPSWSSMSIPKPATLFMWGEETADGSKGLFKLEIDSENKPKFTVAGNGAIHTLTHESDVDTMAWNNITVRWTCNKFLPAESQIAEIFLNGTESEAKIDLSSFSMPTMSKTYFTVGNNNDGGNSANGYFDELRIDSEVKMDTQEKEEIISWFKYGSTFYDVASQIDADSQGISAANARITINNEGISVRDGLIKIISDDGVTLLGGGRINVNGINVGVVQSDNEVYNGNFTVTDTLYGVGDIYVTPDGIQNYGAKYWRSRRSSAPSYSNALTQSAWNIGIVSSVLTPEKIHGMIFDTFNSSLRAMENASHTIEGAVRANEPIKSMPEGPQKEAIVMDMVEDELIYQIDKATESKYADWMALGLSCVRYNDEHGNQVIKAVKFLTQENKFKYVPHKVNQWTGAFEIDIETNPESPNFMMPKFQDALEENGSFGHTMYQVWPTGSYLGKTGYAKLGIDTINNDSTIDVSEQSVSIEQNLSNLVTLTDGMEKDGTHWKQHIFTFYGKWDGEVVPIGEGNEARYVPIDPVTKTPSQARMFFDVDELVPNYDPETGEQLPSFSVTTPDIIQTTNDYLIMNTDFIGARYQVVLGHATFPNDKDHTAFTLNSVRYASILPMMRVRYIRDWVNGNTVDSNNVWSNIAVVNSMGQPVVINPASITSPTGTLINPENIVDINMAMMQPDLTTYASVAGAGPQCIQIDLGQVYVMDMETRQGGLGAIAIHHFFADGRKYHDTRTQISEDGVKWYDIYNSDYQGEYVETIQGHVIGGLTGMNPNPIIVEEVLTERGMTSGGKSQWTIKTDGSSVIGNPDTKYIASTQKGDVLMLALESDSNIDIVMNIVESKLAGVVSIYVDGMFIGDADSSYPIKSIIPLVNKNLPAGRHVLTAIATGGHGFNSDTTNPHPHFAVDACHFYDWSKEVHTTTVEYVETDPSTWNKFTIKPNFVNNKYDGLPHIATSNVPIKYRVRVRFEKPDGDPVSATGLVTGIQAEIGENESFTRANYGSSWSFPGYMIEQHNRQILSSGIGPKHYQNFVPGYIWETGMQERHIADYQITTRKIAPGSVTRDALAFGNITRDKLAFVSKQRLELNVSPDMYEYPIEMPVNTDPRIRYIPDIIDDGSEDIYMNGQLQMPCDADNPDEDYTMSTVVVARHASPIGAMSMNDTQTLHGPGTTYRLNHDRIGHAYGTPFGTVPALTVVKNGTTPLQHGIDYTVNEADVGNFSYKVDISFATPLVPGDSVVVTYLPETHYGNGVSSEFVLQYGKLSYIYNGTIPIPRVSVVKNGTTPLVMGVNFIVQESVDPEGNHVAKVKLLPGTTLGLGEYISVSYLYVDGEAKATKIEFKKNVALTDKMWISYWRTVQ